ncbi:MAG: tetratricopeptide repeat protein [Hyphomicrobiales bacterium]|nr:tetratricopeptide repeat protein [Hyphomicrobiales bacterium]
MSEQEGPGKAADQSRVERWFREGLCLVLAASVAIMICQIVAEVFGGSFMIDPISVPEEFAKKGISAETVSSRIRDEMTKLEQESRMGGEENIVKAIVEGNSAPEINVLGTSISVRYIADALRDMLRYPKISGELSFVDQSQSDEESDAEETNSATSPPGRPPKVRLVLRLSHDRKWLYETEGTYDEVVRDGALAALKVTDPYPAAIYLSRRRAEHAEALALIDRALTMRRSVDARGELARAYVLMDMGKHRYDDARKAFNKANDDHGGNWDAALDGLAVLDIYEKDYDQARKDAEQAINANPRYDFALYHDAQADDEHFRAFVSGQIRMDICGALAKARDARKKYDNLIKQNPNFGAAYSQEAIMLAKELAYVLVNPPLKCESETTNPREAASSINNLAGTINSLFEMGLARDPNFFNGWYEWGFFLILLTEKGVLPPDASPESVADDAINRYEHAIRLVNSDKYLSEVNAYFWACKAQALVRRAEFSSTPDLRRQLLEHARSAYAKYHQLVANTPKAQAPCGDESRIEAELQPVLGAVLARQNGARAPGRP